MTVKIQDFILDEVPEEIEGKTAKKKASPTEYKVEWCDCADFIVSKNTTRTTSYMAIIPSQKQYYIKNNNGSIEALTYESYRKFASKMEQDFRVDANWIETLPKRKEEVENFLSVINSEHFAKYATHDMIMIDIDPRNFGYYRGTCDIDFDRYYTFYAKAKTKLEETGINRNEIKRMFGSMIVWDALGYGRTSFFPDGMDSRTKSLFFERTGNIKTLFDAYGESGVYTIFEHCVENNNEIRWRFRSIADLGNLLELHHVSCKSFIEYFIYECDRQGYYIGEMLNRWRDTLNMQERVYGKIKDKYPKNLESVHKRLSYDVMLLEEAQELEERVKDDGIITQRAKDLSKYLYKDSRYEISVPTCVQDILNEAQEQSNCLASYVKAYVTGKSDIYFMRKTDIDKSLITIEIRDGALRQAYAHHNTLPNPNEREFIRAWCERNGFEYPDHYTPRCA